MGAAEVGDLRRLPTGEAVAALHRLDDPHVDGESFEPAGAEEEHAVGDFFADARERAETFLRDGVGSISVASSQPGCAARNCAVWEM